MTNFAHPLDPLSPDEIKITASVVRSAVLQKKLKNLRFNTITLKVVRLTVLAAMYRTQ
jgi:Cu2+-containing amine oxidase